MIFVYHVGLYYIVTLSSVVRSVDSHIVPFSFLFFFTFFKWPFVFVFWGQSRFFVSCPQNVFFLQNFQNTPKIHCREPLQSSHPQFENTWSTSRDKKKEREKKENVLSECFWLIYPDFWDIITRCNVFRIFLYFYFILIGVFESCAYLNNGFL